MRSNSASPEPRRSAERILDTAEGVLVTLRRYNTNKAFFELAQTAKRHGVTTVALADALVALAQRQSADGCDPRAVDIARQTWAGLLDRNNGPNHAHVAAQPDVLEPDDTDPRESY